MWNTNHYGSSSAKEGMKIGKYKLSIEYTSNKLFRANRMIYIFTKLYPC